jgi:hypothetical protein
MKRLLPGRLDLVFFLLMVFLCGLIVQFCQNRICVLGLLPMPIILAAAVSGLRERLSLDAALPHSQVLPPDSATADITGHST